jgi:hypothetical protein
LPAVSYGSTNQKRCSLIRCVFSVFGTVKDLQALRGIVDKDEYREALEQAPPGIFDARSWAYWNLVCDRRPTPPLPVRAALYPIRPATGTVNPTAP